MTRRLLTTCFLIVLIGGRPAGPAAAECSGSRGYGDVQDLHATGRSKRSASKTRAASPSKDSPKEDFIVTEDGAPQTIAFFEYQKLPEAPSAAITTNTMPAAVVPFPKLPKTTIAPERPGDIRYRDKRLLVLYFDLVAMPIPDQLRALEAAQKFVRTQMTPADLMAIMTFDNGAVQVLQDFTDDRERILSIVETLAVGEDEDATATDASSADTGAAFGQNDAEFNIFFTDRELSALQTAATMLGKLNEKKSLIYFASGLRLNGSNNQAQLHATTNAAIRAGVSFWPIDARGLTADAPLGNASKGSPGGQAMYTGASAMAAMTNIQRTQDTLWTLGADTGGKALLDVNDLSMGIVNAQRVFFELLHPRILHQQCEPGRKIPPHQDFPAGRRLGRSGLPAGLLRRQGFQQILDRR